MSWLSERLARGTKPYPLADLARALGIDPADTRALSNRLGIDRSWVKRARHLGLSDVQADRWATRAGLHPLDVWPFWGDDVPRLVLRGSGEASAGQVERAGHATSPQAGER